MRRQGLRRSMMLLFWRVMNPIARPFAGVVPWWVLVETVGRRTGVVRRTPLAAGPADDTGMLLIAVHGRLSGWVLNLEAEPRIRVRHRGRWRDAMAAVEPMQPGPLREFNAYARSGPRLVGIDPVLVRCRFD